MIQRQNFEYMDFFSLTPTSLADYILENREFSGMWFFHHVPKTAGSSLASELIMNAGPYESVEVSYDDPGSNFDYLRGQAVDKLIAQMAVKQVRSASGHLLAHHTKKIAQSGYPVRFFTFVRHPVKRVISEYNYSRSNLHPPHEIFIEKYPTIGHYLEDPEEHNRCAEYLVEDKTKPIDDILKDLSARFSMIGLQERYPVSFLLLSSMLYETSLPIRKERVGKEPDPVDPGLAHAIEEANAVDLAIYNAVSEVYERIALAIWTLHRDKALAPEL